MSSTTHTKNDYLIDYLTRHGDVKGACLTAALACEGGGKNYHTHSKRLLSVLKEIRKEASVSEENKQSFDAVLERAEGLAAEKEKWGGDYEGVCIHVSKDTSELIRLRYPPVEVSMVGDQFCYRPAADALAARSEMLVLHLSFKGPRLFRFDGEAASVFGEIELPESVFSMSEDTALDAGQRGHVRRSGAGTNAPTAPATVNQGVSRAQSPRDLNEPVYLREVAHALESVEESKKLPLVVVGDDNIVGEFLKSYQHSFVKVERATLKNSHPNEADIAQMASEIDWKQQQDQKQSIIETLKQEEQKDTSFNNNLREVYEAATQGRVQHCVVACDENAWCRVGEDGVITSADPEKDSDAFEALDRIYTESLLNGGQAIVLPMSEIPGGKKVAAQFKW